MHGEFNIIVDYGKKIIQTNEPLKESTCFTIVDVVCLVTDPSCIALAHLVDVAQAVFELWTNL